MPAVNKARAGSSIPVKFRLDGDFGPDIFAEGYPRSEEIDCDFTTPGDSEATMTTGGSGLTYDAGSGQYHYVWKTEKDWAGSCRQLIVMLKDGSYRYARFMFR